MLTIRRRALIALLVLLAAIVGCSPQTEEPLAAQNATVTPVPQSTSVCLNMDNAQRIAMRFLDAWQASDFTTMYTLLSPSSQAATPEADFIALYENSHAEMTLTGLSVQPNVLVPPTNNNRVSVLNYNATFETVALGTFTDPNRDLQLILETAVCDWRIAWSPGDIFAEMGDGARLRLERQIPRRASIYDRNGVVLADQQGAVVSVRVVRGDIPNYDACMGVLAGALEDTVEDVSLRVNRARIDWEAEIGTMEAPSLDAWRPALEQECSATFGSAPARRYIDGALAPHIMGTVGYMSPEEVPTYEALGFQQDSIIGRSGIEGNWDEALRGQPGGSLLVQTLDGVVLRVIAERTPQPAQSVYLTLDIALQREAMQLIADAYARNAEGFARTSAGGSAVVLNVNTGEVLALVSWPTFDANALAPFPAIGSDAAAAIQQQLTGDESRPLLNRPTQGVYPAGSTFKVVPAIGAADMGLYGLTQRYYTSTGSWTYEGDTRTDWLAGGHGYLNLPEALTHSCNSCFYEAGFQMNLIDPYALPSYARRLGLGNLTGIGSDIAESAGFIGDPDWVAANRDYLWSYRDAIAMAIGQGEVQVTPLQMARMYAAIANGGALYRPQLVQTVQLIDDVSYTMQPEVSALFGVDAEILAMVRTGICAVTTASYGTAEFVFRQYPQLQNEIGVCGKTGTAEDPPRAQTHAWFIGYAPRENPEILVAVMIENSGEGSEVAAPLVAEIMSYYFDVDR